MSDEQILLPQPSKEARQWAMFCHLSALLGIWIPFGTLIGPLVLWQLKRESDPFIDAQGKEALNFQITVAIASAISLLLMVVVIGFFLFGLVAIGALVLTIIGGVKANEGQPYRYPFTWRLVK
ncbi:MULTISPECIES: DUF4870 domain-containing protein [Pseudomonas]|jgi:Uncharacterized protein conserved in bacteria|uniref:DUF4870 domain-containing protein n=4 Tax=Pseudomonas TaxID=286 RepID=A0ABM6R7P6_PSEO1|nr:MULTISPECIES: DUF4870 domain-containing protein [Pseudomonas]AEA72054.1 Conserved hypothetical protein [Pseudomonas brassicacearum subsp. brassicacearum NFM421]AEV65741.1 Hypothetical protein PSF113_5767 [Pseudomonas ogarae]ALQ06541.1 hypothetical protein AK973_6092 [Pseudomonas brassicacearum]AMZ73640.1 orotate phosphoribosyltransferase [Pseudomonas fluorescens]AOS40432.1 orotate phosphoribosyltransferase [Pseudomonas brassicacearum]